MAVTKLEIRLREPYNAGPGMPAYERIDGIAHYAVDPAHPANTEIVDLDLAARGADGLVHFDGDFSILRPVDGGARKLLSDVPNRGNRPVMGQLNRAPRVLVPTTEIDPGDGFLFERGWTVAWTGWQWDIADHPAFLGFRAPMALQDGKPIPGRARVEIANSVRRYHAGLRDESLGPSIQQVLPAADLEEAGAELMVQEFPGGPRTAIPRDRWRFARQSEDGTVTPDAGHVWLEGGFDPGRIYTIYYTTSASPVVGAGLLAMRDFASFLRYGSAEDGNPAAGAIDRAYSIGVSQSGRFQRTMLYHGLNADEQDRTVFDAFHIHIAGGRRGEFNWRYAMPSVEGAFGFGHLPPHLDGPGDGYDGLLAKQRAAGHTPKLLYTNTSGEYWRGDASFVHNTLDDRDAPLGEDTRLYMFAGAAHSPGILPFTKKNAISGDLGLNRYNVLDYRPLTRAALVNLDRWVCEGVEPPPSAYPMQAASTLVTREEVIACLGAIPPVATPGPEGLRRMRAMDFGPGAAKGILQQPPIEGVEYTSRVSAVNSDGNDVAGIRLPDITSPIATYSGWNPRDPVTGGAGQVLRLAGSTVPFARTPEEKQPGDPRPAISERYASRAAYEDRLRADARALVSKGFLLDSDIEITVAAALERYDAVMADA